jgi:monovalent cation/hydrogen antiporter
VGRVRGMYEYRRRRFTARVDGDGDETYEERTDQYRRLMSELYDAQREQLIEMRNALEISDEVRRRIERDLDLEESRLA